MTQKLVEYVFVVSTVAGLGLFVGYTMGGWIGGLPLMVVGGIFGHKYAMVSPE